MKRKYDEVSGDNPEGKPEENLEDDFKVEFFIDDETELKPEPYFEIENGTQIDDVKIEILQDKVKPENICNENVKVEKDNDGENFGEVLPVFKVDENGEINNEVTPASDDSLREGLSTGLIFLAKVLPEVKAVFNPLSDVKKKPAAISRKIKSILLVIS